MVLFGLGVIGLCGMTWLFPTLAWIAKKSSELPCMCHDKSNENKSNHGIPHSLQLSSLDVLIPAHNEESQIRYTLDSIQTALNEVKQKYPYLKSKKIVGVDGCTDKTAEIVRAEGKSRLIESLQPRGKWNTLLSLVQESHADWVVFADVGVLWPHDLIMQMLIEISKAKTIGLAPSYSFALENKKKNYLQKLIWTLESKLKNIENEVGGPISVHGATVAYSRLHLLEALKALEGVMWLNDDIAIPLQLRKLFPESKIVYLTEFSVFDYGHIKSVNLATEFRRRMRMVRGNLQWMKLLVRETWKQNKVAGLLTLRRVFRLLWIYWALFVNFGILSEILTYLQVSTTYVILIYLGLIILSISGALIVKPLQKLLAAALASAMAPIDLIFNKATRKISWT